jgi:EAL domain-containing protein (putative c-di-GMP-specific phosphodiesterase class I)
VLDRLRESGVRIAIDDFGSGYSALWYLRDLPVDEVKLDRQFIAPVLVDPRAAAIVRAVIDLAHVLGVTTVAEGIEDALTTVHRWQPRRCRDAFVATAGRSSRGIDRSANDVTG